MSIAEVHTLTRTRDVELDPDVDLVNRVWLEGAPLSDVTVVIATIEGRDELLQRALLSAQRQTRPPRSMIVVKDKERRGAAFARNLGLSQVDTTWTAWLDDDDEMLPEHLEALVGGAVDAGADMAYSYMEIVGGRDPLAVDDGTGNWVKPLGIPFGPVQERHLRTRGNFIPVTYLVRTQLAQDVGGMPDTWSPDWPRGEEDYGLLIRLLDAGAKFVHVPQVTWRYYVHDSNTGGVGPDMPGGGGAASPRFRGGNG